jgi:hypothetical protein
VSRRLALLGLALAACRSDAELPAAGSTTATDRDACEASSDCDDARCVASWDAALDERGPAECVSECVGDTDLARFCLDDAACCDGLRCNEVDGLCTPIEAGTSSTTGAGTSEGSDDDSSTSAG